jgi:hypothetical protein
MISTFSCDIRGALLMPRGREFKNLEARKIAGAVTDGAKRADRFGQRVSSVAEQRPDGERDR